MGKLFQTPTPKTIGGVALDVGQVPFSAFDEAMVFGEWLMAAQGGAFDVQQLQALERDSPVRDAMEKLLAACLAQDGVQLSVQDVRSMPIPMVMEAAMVVMEANLDFFIQSLAAIRPIQARLMSIGSPLLSSSLPPDTTASRSSGTATPS